MTDEASFALLLYSDNQPYMFKSEYTEEEEQEATREQLHSA